MTLRFAEAAEAAALAALHRAAFPAEAWDAPAIAALLALPGGFALRGEGGFLLARLAADEAEILTLAVIPAARRAGLGRALVEGACAFAGAQGARAMFLEVGEDNAAALALYAAAGFERVGGRRGYYGPGRDAAVLRRALAA